VALPVITRADKEGNGIKQAKKQQKSEDVGDTRKQLETRQGN
jgi:hypothetical protein